MKPYRKTYRASKDHKATECGICAEAVDKSPSPIRQEAAKQIRGEDLRKESVIQKEHNENEDWYWFNELY